MRKLILAAGFVASLGVSGLADTAAAQPPYYHHYQHRHYARCRYERHRSGAIGAVAGAIGGGIIGSALTHGRAGGTLLGAGAGALTGHALARSTVHC
jgi:outer membrane lipoprotein SlyB